MPRTGRDLRLHNGARIAVIGAGPAGSIFAHFARRLADEQGLRVSIRIFDGKDFARRGPAGCNMGAGVVSERVAWQLSKEGFELPAERVQSRIGGYFLQTHSQGFQITHPSGKHDILSFFRGGGPRHSLLALNVSFDDFLLEHVERHGHGVVEVVREPVVGVLLPRRPEEPVSITYGRGPSPYSMAADLVVGAFGVNSAMLTRLADLGFGYRPPRTVRACQTELTLGPEVVRQAFGENVHAFILRGSDGTRFAAITPKGSHATVTLMGKRDMTLDDMEEFLASPPVRLHLPDGCRLDRGACHCFPRLSLSPARHPFADRLVIIGDAAYCRYYKNGFESAFFTARLAAEAAFRRGISAEAFDRHYAGPAWSTIAQDNLYGQFLYRLADSVSGSDLLLEVCRRVAARSESDSGARRLHACLWGMLTGDVTYRQTLLTFLNFALLRRLGATSLSVLAGRLARPSTAFRGWLHGSIASFRIGSTPERPGGRRRGWRSCWRKLRHRTQEPGSPGGTGSRRPSIRG